MLLFTLVLIAILLFLIPKGLKKAKKTEYPWRPMDNRERRAHWASAYYLLYEPGNHPRNW